MVVDGALVMVVVGALVMVVVACLYYNQCCLPASQSFLNRRDCFEDVGIEIDDVDPKQVDLQSLPGSSTYGDAYAFVCRSASSGDPVHERLAGGSSSPPIRGTGVKYVRNNISRTRTVLRHVQ